MFVEKFVEYIDETIRSSLRAVTAERCVGPNTTNLTLTKIRIDWN